MSGLPPVADLLPHAAPMLVLESLLDWEPGRCTARMLLRADHPFVRDGHVAGVCLFEFMAQAVAACLGCEASSVGESVRAGMVIACRSMSVDCDVVPVGAELLLRARRVRGTKSISLFETEAELGGRVVSRAMMTLFHGGPVLDQPVLDQQALAQPARDPPARGEPTSR